MKKKALVLGIGGVLAALGTSQANPPPPFPIASPVAGYQPVISPLNIAPTTGTVDDPNRKVEVVGQPRMAQATLAHCGTRKMSSATSG